jgi:hypothetical protein
MSFCGISLLSVCLVNPIVLHGSLAVCLAVHRIPSHTHTCTTSQTTQLVEFTAIKEDLTKFKQKYDGSKARNKALSREVKNLKDAAAEATAFTTKTQREIATLKVRCIEMARDKGLLLQAFEATPNAGGSLYVDGVLAMLAAAHCDPTHHHHHHGAVFPCSTLRCHQDT